MYNLVNSNFNRTYNPSGRQNALSDIKRLLTSRDTESQKKGCGYIIDVIGRYNKSSNEGTRLVEYLLDNDITVFLCEATSNLDFSLFKSLLTCLRLLWRDRRFFAEEHAAQAVTAVLRSLAHYASSGPHVAVDACLQFLCDLLTGISNYETTSPLSHQSAYSAIQLLACLNALVPKINTNPNTILSSALVLHSLLCYQPKNLIIKANTATALVEVVNQWFVLLMGALNHSTLVGDGTKSGMFLVVICHLGSDVLGLMKLLLEEKQRICLVETILADDEENTMLKQCAVQMKNSVHHAISELVSFTKENQSQIPTEHYGVFLKFLLTFLHDSQNAEHLADFCDVLFSKGYLTMLPQVQLVRKDMTVRKVSTLVLGEMLKVLSEKYLNVDDVKGHQATCARDIHMGLIELQNGIEKPQNIGMQLQRRQPYSLLIYIYFYCQSSENPEEATAPLLPYLVEHILKLPKSFSPPTYIIKALWLVFAMSTISNGSLESLEERVYLEKATNRLMTMMEPEPSIYYTHHPAMLLWAFTSLRIPNYIRLQVLSQWLKFESSIPENLAAEPTVWELLLNVLIHNKDTKTVTNCMKVLQDCLEDGGDCEQEFAALVWSVLPSVLSKALIDDFETDTNIIYLLDLATMVLPNEIDPTVCLKVAVLIATIFSKNKDYIVDMMCRYHYEHVCLKLGLYLLGLCNDQNDNRVILIFINRPGFLPNVLTATNSMDDRVACVALQLLSHIVYYFTKNQYEPKSVLQIQTHLVIKSLQRDSSNERGECLIQLVYMMLSAGANTPLTLSYDLEETPSQTQQCNALRALMFRVQLMLCCRDSENQILAGWKTLSSIFRHAILGENDPQLVVILTSQPWTHTLVQFQLTQNITEEFLTFVQNWLTLLKITIKKSQVKKRRELSKYSLTVKTLMLLKKHLVGSELKELKEKTLAVAWEIIDISEVRL